MIQTERLLLRAWREEDVEPYARMCADPEVMRYLPTVLTREQSEEQIWRFVSHWERRRFGLWAVEEKATGSFMGFIGLSYQQDWPEGEHRTEVGWRLDRPFWGRGFATEGAEASVRFGFERLGLGRIISVARPDNLSSRRVMEKTGLTLQGATRWRGQDVVWYAIDRGFWQARWVGRVEG
jgi:RimJ/RimL family protein N-acetyltransferase